jgi:hypothetical protein
MWPLCNSRSRHSQSPDLFRRSRQRFSRPAPPAREHVASDRSGVRRICNCPGYELVLDPAGPALEPVVPHSGPDGLPSPSAPRTSARRDGSGHQRNQYQERRTGDLATHLGFQVGRALGRSVDAACFQPRVVDKTGLPGTYSFILEYDCPGCVAPAAPPTVDADGGGGFARLAPVPEPFRPRPDVPARAGTSRESGRNAL